MTLFLPVEVELLMRGLIPKELEAYHCHLNDCSQSPVMSVGLFATPKCVSSLVFLRQPTILEGTTGQ